jgi:hypothetical protein
MTIKQMKNRSKRITVQHHLEPVTQMFMKSLLMIVKEMTKKLPRN